MSSLITLKDLLDLFEPYLTAEDLQECLDELKKDGYRR